MDNREEKKALHAGHRQRMRKRFISSQGENFAEHELLEMLLFYSIPCANTNEIAHKLIRQFGSFANVFDEGDCTSFTLVDGIGEKSATLLSVMSSVMKAYELSAECVRELSQTPNYEEYIVFPLLCELEEMAMIAYLTVTGKVIYAEKLKATSGENEIDLYKLVKMATQLNCSHIIMTHKYVNQSAFPLQKEIDQARDISNALEPLEIELVDYITIGSSGDTYSMKENMYI